MTDKVLFYVNPKYIYANKKHTLVLEHKRAKVMEEGDCGRMGGHILVKNMPYCDMLEYTGLPRLELRRSLLKLSLTFKIVHGLVYFPNDTYSLSITRSSPRISHSLSLCLYSSSSSQFLSLAFPIPFLSGMHYP